jgi:RNA polymerase sigma-70 factor (ECF subfamily)
MIAMGRQHAGSDCGMNEQTLVQAAQSNDLRAFNQLVLTYQESAYNVAYRILGDADAAADATQDTFLKAFRRLNQYRGGSFRAWLLRIATNTCYDVLRARRRRPASSLESRGALVELDARLSDHRESPHEHLMRQELAQAIQTAIGSLPADQRTVLVLYDIEGLDYKEIAEATGAALGTVKSRLSRARAQVRSKLMAQKDLLGSTGVTEIRTAVWQ